MGWRERVRVHSGAAVGEREREKVRKNSRKKNMSDLTVLPTFVTGGRL